MKKLIFLLTMSIFALISNAQPLLIPKGIKALTYTITPTEVSYLHGATSNVQIQINGTVKKVDLVDPSSIIDSLAAITTLVDKTDNYTLQFSGTFTSTTNDLGKTITVTAATAKVITVPTNAVAPFPIGSTITIIQGGAGEVSFAGSGITFKSESSWVKIGAQEAAVQLIKIATDTWRIIGRLKA